VDNLLAYVEDERYRGVWINRAAENFVLQMGGFYSHTKRPPPLFASTGNVATFAPVIGTPGIPGLSNTVGTVSMALQPNNPNSGTSSFFVNLANNSGLDNQFTVFAAIPDMTVINAIMALPRQDLAEHFGLDPDNLAFIDVPIMDDGKQVFIKRAFVVSDAMTIAMANSAVAPLMAASLAAAGSGGLSSTPTPAAAVAAAVPEPASTVLLLVALSVAALAPRRR
jgi:cyclophilin family peptidyl-prolyl cis-trans isomerase